ncbi:MAG: tRNA (adenosine(37)-N6)-threonylcarbamoyltransferase complex dimerization subunit type 1 TsaB [Ginsengibacter sp.]
MAYILNIHTATETALVSLADGPVVLGTLTNEETKQHAAFLHLAIDKLLKDRQIAIKELEAIGVSSGPGSYTGIRVGLAAAKGLCFALNIPMINYNSLELLALSAMDFANDAQGLYCPMIDARRMEVYTALYKFTEVEVFGPSALILSEDSFSSELRLGKVYFSGSGTDKFEKLIKNQNAIFLPGRISAGSIARLSWRKFEKQDFRNTAYLSPLYIKEFHTILKT